MSAKVEVVSKSKVNLKVTTVAGSGSGVSDHGQLTGLLDDDHPQYQRSEAVWVTTDTHDIVNESVTITTGSMIALPPAESMAGRVVTVGAAAQAVTIEAVGGDTLFDDPGNDYLLPQGNGVSFVALQIGTSWGWAIEVRNGPAFDMPKWYGQSLADGQVIKISGGVPAWGTAPSSGVTSVSGTAPISVAGTTTPTVSIAAASTSAAGSMSSADKTKLDGIATGATANSPDATLLARANHTGTQTLSTISDAGTAAAKNVPATGDASSTQVVLGSDTRLTNARVPQWRRLTFSDAAYDLSTTPSPAVSGSVVLQQTGTLSAARTVTLPAASACPAGSEIIVNAGAGASATNTVTIQRAGTDTINGATTSVVIGTAWGQRRFVSDGVSAWAHDDGLMRRSQNLADLASASTARTNLQLVAIAASGSASDLTTGTVPSARLALTASDIPAHDASKITTGTLGVARLGTQASPTSTPYASNDWVPLWSPLGTGSSTGTMGGSATASNNLARYQPVWIGQSVSLVGLGVDISAANAGATAVVRLGLYNDSSGRPGTVAVDAGTASIGTAVAKELTFSSVALSPGWYWLAVVFQNIDTAGTNPALRTAAAFTALAPRTAVPSATSLQVAQFTTSSVSGAFSASPTVTLSTSNTAAYMVWGKFA